MKNLIGFVVDLFTVMLALIGIVIAVMLAGLPASILVVTLDRVLGG